MYIAAKKKKHYEKKWICVDFEITDSFIILFYIIKAIININFIKHIIYFRTNTYPIMNITLALGHNSANKPLTK